VPYIVYIHDVRYHFTYLRVKLVNIGNLRFAVKALNEQALRAFKTLLLVCKYVSLDIKMKLYKSF